MIRIIKKIPSDIVVACSGGIDSMVVCDFLLRGKRNLKLAYFNHDTRHAYEAEKFVKNFADSNNLDLVIGRVVGQKGRRESLEEFWRNERYDFFSSIKHEFIITCHHLDDCVETWLMSSFHGQSKMIPYHRQKNIYRPFLMTEKSSIRKYAKKHNLNWIEDPTNKSQNFDRNHVRMNIIPQVLKIHPGLRTTIRKKMIEHYLK